MKAYAPLDLDFGTGWRRPRRVGIALLAAGGAAAIFAVTHAGFAYRDWQSEKARHDALLSRMQLQQGADQKLAVATPFQKAGFRNAAQIASQLRTPWPNLLKLLETVPMDQVALLSVEPIASGRQLRLSAEAKNLDAMLTYLDFLQRQPMLRGVTLVSHQVQKQSAGAPVRFQLQAQWGDQ